MKRLLSLFGRDPGDRWATVFGRIAVYSFLAACVTGVLLLPFFTPSMTPVVYHGSYRQLDGATMSGAYQSVLGISFDVRGGLLIRQVHHWASLVFVAAVCLRLLRVFFRGSVKGRLPDWLLWVTLIPLGMVAGLTGTILPDDMLSGGSLSVFTGVALSVPFVGTHLVTLVFGGTPPGHVIIGRAYWVHIIVLPVLIGALLLVANWPSVRRFAARRLRLRALRLRALRLRVDPVLPASFGVLVLLGAIAQINPVWLYGPYQPGSISAGSVPDWYMGFIDGALRIMPGWEFSIGGHPLTLAVLVPALLMPGLFFTLLAGYPLVDRLVTRERPPSGLLPPRPGDPANRIGAGVAGIAFYGVLWAAAANDEIAYHLNLSLYAVTWTFRVLVLAGPVVVFVLTRGLCHFAAARRLDEAAHGRETGVLVANPAGGFSERHEPVPVPGGRELVPGERELVVQSGSARRIH